MTAQEPFELLLITRDESPSVDVAQTRLTRVLDVGGAETVLCFARFDLVLVRLVDAADPGWAVVHQMRRMWADQPFAVMLDEGCPELELAARTAGAVAVVDPRAAEEQLGRLVHALRARVLRPPGLRRN